MLYPVTASLSEMPHSLRLAPAALATVILVAAGCASASRPATTTASKPIGIAAMKHTAADVSFMRGMIHHHAQAVVMAKWAPTHGARGAA